MGGQDAQSGGRHPVETTGLTYRARLRHLELGAGFIGKAGDGVEIHAGQNQTFVTPEGFDVGDLALQIDIVFRVDLEMDSDPWVNGR
jgi:hypothetical protein